MNRFFKSKVDIHRIKVDKRENIETLINEEILLLAQFLREEHEKSGDQEVLRQMLFEKFRNYNLRGLFKIGYK